MLIDCEKLVDASYPFVSGEVKPVERYTKRK